MEQETEMALTSQEPEDSFSIPEDVMEELKNDIAQAVVDNISEEQASDAIVQFVKNGQIHLVRAAIVKFGLSHVNTISDDGMAILHTAACENHGDIARYLLNECGADVNLPDAEGKTALHHAVVNNNFDLVILLTDLAEDLDFHARCSRNRSALHFAAMSKNPDIVRFVLERNADVGLTCSEGRTPLHCAAHGGCLESMHLLLQHNSDSNVQDVNGRLPLHEAAVAGNIDAFRCLLEMTANPFSGDYFSRTCLHESAAEGHVSVVELLLQLLSESKHYFKDTITVDAKDFWPGETPLLKAASGGHTEVMKVLLLSGPDPRVTNNMGRTALHLATSSGVLECVDYLLDHTVADVNAQDKDGTTPLHIAVTNYRKDLVELLIKHNCSVNVQDRLGKPALHYAVVAKSQSDEDQCDEIVNILCAQKCRVNSQDIFGNTYLHLFISAESAASCLRCGGDVNARNVIGMTPLHHACIRHRADMVQLFAKPEYQLDVNAQDVYGVTALHYAMSHYDVELYDQTIEDTDVDVKEYMGYFSAEDRVKNASLKRIISGCDVTITKMLLEHGARVNIQTFINRKTPLHVAFENYSLNERIATMLLGSKDIDLSCRDSMDVSPDNYVVFDRSTILRETDKLCDTVDACTVHLKQQLVLGKSIKELYNQNIILFYSRQIEKFKESFAADANSDMTIEEHGCRRFVPESQCRWSNLLNRSFLHMLVYSFDIITTDELEYYLAIIPKEAINSRDSLGRTPLFYATMHSKLHVAISLTRFGADSKLADNDSITPEDLAVAIEWHIMQKNEMDSAFLADLRNLKGVWNANANIPLEISKSAHKVKVIGTLKDEQWRDICKTEKNEAQAEFDNTESICQIWETLETLKSKAHYIGVIRYEVRRFVDKLISETTKVDERLRADPIMLGSSYEGTRTDFPEEFDFNMRLLEFERICDYEVVSGYHPGFVQMKVRHGCSSDEFNEFFSKSGHLQAHLLKDKLFAVIKKVLNQSVVWQDGTFEYLTFSVTSDRLMPAITLHLQLNRLVEQHTGNLFIFGEPKRPSLTSISIDLAPVIKINLDRRNNTFIFPPKDEYFAICTLKSPKDYFNADVLGICSVSFAMVEKESIRNSPPVVKAGFMVAKRIAEQHAYIVNFGTNIIKYSVLNCLFRNRFPDKVMSSVTVEPELLIECVRCIFAEIRQYALDDAIPSPFVEGHWYPFWFRDCAAESWPAYFRRYGLDMRTLVYKYKCIHNYVFSCGIDDDVWHRPDPLAGYLFGYMLQTLSNTLMLCDYVCQNRLDSGSQSKPESCAGNAAVERTDRLERFFYTGLHAPDTDRLRSYYWPASDAAFTSKQIRGGQIGEEQIVDKEPRRLRLLLQL